MVLMFLLESLFWPGRGLAWKASPKRGSSSAAVATNVPPWGQIEYVPIALDRPEDYFTNEFETTVKPAWIFRNHTEQQVNALLASLNLSAGALAHLTNRAHWEVLPRAIVISPPPEAVTSLSADTRRQLYDLLAHNPANWAQATPFRFRADGLDDWFADCGLSKSKIELVRKLTYVDQGNLCFADAATFAQLSTPDETKCLIKGLWRVSTFVMKLRVDPRTDVDQIMKYWDKFGSARAYKPLVESVSRVPEGSSINISYFLPPFARLRLYTYPDPRDPHIAQQDCFWSAMNFFNSTPDDGFFNSDHTRQVLKSDYVHVADDSRQFGDLLLLLGQHEKALHLCVYLADGVVFTKNGANTQQPWVLMKLQEMLGQYETEKPYQIVVYRRRTPVPGAALQFSAFARAEH